jgi:hypothetical protein
MRLWTIHPSRLDPQGLVALWREALLARAVLRGRTEGYRHHPQLDRFRAHPTPRRAISVYLAGVYDEASARGYSFDRAKVGPVTVCPRITVTDGQLDHEWERLLGKLRRRSPDVYRRLVRMSPAPHPIFRVVRGPVASWERAAP